MTMTKTLNGGQKGLYMNQFHQYFHDSGKSREDSNEEVLIPRNPLENTRST